MASGMSARATTVPASRSARTLENHSCLISAQLGRKRPLARPVRMLMACNVPRRFWLPPEFPQGATVLARAPRRNVRPRSADLVALLQAGELDYAWLYESVARSAGLDYLRLGQPLTLDRVGKRAHHRILTDQRIESGWWDGGDIRRDYYLVRTSPGQLAWVYRRVGDSGPLLLHGWFA